MFVSTQKLSVEVLLHTCRSRFGRGKADITHPEPQAAHSLAVMSSMRIVFSHLTLAQSLRYLSTQQEMEGLGSGGAEGQEWQEYKWAGASS